MSARIRARPASARARVALAEREIRTATIGAPNDPAIYQIRRDHFSSEPDRSPGPSFTPRPSAALATCLAPCSVEEFGRHWGKEYLHIRRDGDASAFRDVLSLESLDALLAEHRVPRETIFVTDANDPKTSEFEYLPPDSPIGADLASIGASLYFHFLDQFSAPLRDFCDQLETSLGLPFSAFAFLNPPHAQARPLHWDPLDVFILQVEGDKVWDIHEPLVHLPLATQDSKDYHFDTPRIARVTLRPGDTLYVPRGFIHKAESTRNISFSITLGALPIGWHHLFVAAMRRALQAVQWSPALRAPVPAWDRASAWAPMLDQVLGLAEREARPRLLCERAKSEVRTFEGSKLRLTPGYLSASYLDADALAALRFAPTPAPFHVEARATKRELVQNGYRCVVTASEVECMKWVRRRRSFRFGELARRFPRVDVRDLLQRLLKTGFVRAE